MERQQLRGLTPVDIKDAEITLMQEKTDQKVYELIAMRMARFFGDDFEKREDEVTKRTAIYRKDGATLLMIDGQPALEMKSPKWIPSAKGVDCHIEYKEYDISEIKNYLTN